NCKKRTGEARGAGRCKEPAGQTELQGATRAGSPARTDRTAGTGVGSHPCHAERPGGLPRQPGDREILATAAERDRRRADAGAGTLGGTGKPPRLKRMEFFRQTCLIQIVPQLWTGRCKPSSARQVYSSCCSRSAAAMPSASATTTRRN